MFAKFKGDFFRQLLALLPTLVNSFFCGCHLHWLSNAAFYLRQPSNVPHASVTDCTRLATCLEIGKIFAAWPGGILLDKFGSKKMTVVVGFLNSVTWTALIFCNELTPLYVIRIFSGISLTLNFCTFVTIAGELSSVEFRSVYSAIKVVALRCAAIFLGSVSLIFSSYQSLAISAASLSLVAFPTLYFVLESPYFLVHNGNLVGAKENVEILHPNYSSKQIDEKFDALKRHIESERSAKASKSTWQTFTERTFRKTLTYVCLINGLVQLSGGQMIMTYVTIILPTNTLVPNSFYPFFLNVVVLVAQLAWTVVIEKFPRRRLFYIACVLNGFTLSFTGAIYYYNLQEPWLFIVVGCVTTVVAVSGSMLAPLIEIVSTELFPFSVKGKANACVYMSRSAFLLVGYQLFDFISTNSGLFGNFYFYAIVVVALSTIVYFKLPETRGKSLASLQPDYHNVKTKTECDGNCEHTPPAYGSIAV